MNTPFFVSGVSFLDVVFARNVDDKLYLKSASIRGGHSTYRIILNASAAEKDFQQRWRQLQSLGCTYESADLGYRLYAIDVIPTADINRVYTLLEIGVSDGVWDFEEGHCAHTPGAT